MKMSTNSGVVDVQRVAMNAVTLPDRETVYLTDDQLRSICGLEKMAKEQIRRTFNREQAESGMAAETFGCSMEEAISDYNVKGVTGAFLESIGNRDYVDVTADGIYWSNIIRNHFAAMYSGIWSGKHDPHRFD